VTSTTASLISFGCIFGGSLAGIVLRSVLPERYFTDEEKDVLRLGLRLITTLSALVLGLLISTAKSSYDAKRSQVTQLATNVILVDRSLELYGSETKSVRHALRDQIAALITQIDSLTPGTPKLRPSSEADLRDFYQMVRRLSPRDDSQRSLKIADESEIGAPFFSEIARSVANEWRGFCFLSSFSPALLHHLRQSLSGGCAHATAPLPPRPAVNNHALLAAARRVNSLERSDGVISSALRCSPSCPSRRDS
jgi:hypothetical protein